MLDPFQGSVPSGPPEWFRCPESSRGLGLEVNVADAEWRPLRNPGFLLSGDKGPEPPPPSGRGSLEFSGNEQGSSLHGPGEAASPGLMLGPRWAPLGQEGPTPTSTERCVGEHRPGAGEPGDELCQWRMFASPHLTPPKLRGTRQNQHQQQKEKTKPTTVRPHEQCGQCHGVMRTVPSPSAGIASSPMFQETAADSRGAAEGTEPGGRMRTSPAEPAGGREVGCLPDL